MKHDIFNSYVNIISDRFDIPKEDLFKRTKRRDLVDARHLLYYLCAKRPMRIKYIQDYMTQNGYKINHSSVIYGIDSVAEKMKSDKDYVSIIRSIESSVHL